MANVKLPLNVQKVSWTASSSNAWGAQLTGTINLYANHTYMIIANFPTISTGEGNPVFIYDSTNWIKPIKTGGTAVWIITPTIDLIGTMLKTAYSASVTYSDTSRASLSVIQLT